MTRRHLLYPRSRVGIPSLMGRRPPRYPFQSAYINNIVGPMATLDLLIPPTTSTLFFFFFPFNSPQHDAIRPKIHLPHKNALGLCSLSKAENAEEILACPRDTAASSSPKAVRAFSVGAERKRKCDGQLPCETCSNASRPHLCEYRAKKGKERSYWRDGSPSADSTSSSQSSSRVLWIEPTVVYANGIASRPPQSARRSSRSSTNSWPRRESIDSFLDYPISSPALNLSSQLSLPATGYEVFPLPPSNFDAVWSDDAIDEYIALLDMHISLPQCSLELDPPVDAWPCGL
ncbi:hypothetical protein C8F01DRAFT_1367614 [Mycena amicta]|nr:hypothetical protein C8F01DRAFT_1367614 [Mycena amicta]